MELVAEELAAFLRRGDTPVASEQTGDKSVASPKEITAAGDVARMLKLPEHPQVYQPESVTIHQVTAGNGLWRPSREADVLLLGDSFTNIFSLEALGWGESAGFAEQLSAALGGRPLDCILRNSDGAFATREMLANELARGRDRLAGKKLVLWEFAARELAFGDWKLLNLKLGQPTAARFFSPPPGTRSKSRAQSRRSLTCRDRGRYHIEITSWRCTWPICERPSRREAKGFRPWSIFGACATMSGGRPPGCGRAIASPSACGGGRRWQRNTSRLTGASWTIRRCSSRNQSGAS